MDFDELMNLRIREFFGHGGDAPVVIRGEVNGKVHVFIFASGEDATALLELIQSNSDVTPNLTRN